MSDGVVTRPETAFDGESHTYRDADGNRLLGVSSVAKIGEAEDSFGIGAAWGFRVGYEGAHEIFNLFGDEPYRGSKDDLRGVLNREGLTPWGQRDRAAARGNWAHDLLEALATDGTVPVVDGKWAGVDDEYRGHARAILQWYLDFRPSFVATEVQVTSVAHGFAGRYDIRCKISVSRLVERIKFWLPEGHLVRDRLEFLALTGTPALALVDLKTSKRIYPTSHFVQLEGYELASVEMGFPPTDVRLVLNTHPDGTYDVGVGYATGADFLAYSQALRSIRGLKELDPEERAKRATEQAILALLPALSREVAGSPGCPETAKEVGRILGSMRKRGLVSQGGDKIWSVC